MGNTATDGSLMGLGVSRSVPSSPGERSPSDKFSLATCDHVSGSGDVSPSGPQLPPPYNNKSPGPMLRSSDQSPTGVQVPHINIWAHCDSEGGHVCHVWSPGHVGPADTDTGVWSSDPDTQDTSAQVSASSVFCRQSTLESPGYQPSPHHRHPYHSVPSQPSMTSPSPPASPRHRQPQQWPVLGSSTEESPHSPDRHTDTCNCRSRVTFGPIHVSPLSSPGGVESSEMMTTIRTATPQPTLPSDLSEHLTP